MSLDCNRTFCSALHISALLLTIVTALLTTFNPLYCIWGKILMIHNILPTKTFIMSSIFHVTAQMVYIIRDRFFFFFLKYLISHWQSHFISERIKNLDTVPLLYVHVYTCSTVQCYKTSTVEKHRGNNSVQFSKNGGKKIHISLFL